MGPEWVAILALVALVVASALFVGILPGWDS